MVSLDHKIIGVISDTHGLIRPEALSALKGVDFIIHAGDVGKLTVLTALESIAPVVAIRGNVDRGETDHLPDTEMIETGDLKIYVTHDVNDLDIDPVALGFNVVISGHSHKPSTIEKDGVLYLNPGAAGQRRFRLPISVATLTSIKNTPIAEIIELEV
jgi:putative phosphoesterase